MWECGFDREKGEEGSAQRTNIKAGDAVAFPPRKYDPTLWVRRVDRLVSCRRRGARWRGGEIPRRDRLRRERPSWRGHVVVPAPALGATAAAGSGCGIKHHAPGPAGE